MTVGLTVSLTLTLILPLPLTLTLSLSLTLTLTLPALGGVHFAHKHGEVMARPAALVRGPLQ